MGIIFGMNMDFDNKKRQQFLTETNFHATRDLTLRVLQRQKNNLSKPEGADEGWHLSMWFGIAEGTFNNFILSYTAGESIEQLRYTLENVIVSYENYLQALVEQSSDPNEMAFPIRSFDGYCPYIGLISLCFLLHRKDLLPRVARLVDGEDEENAGEDVLIEEMLAYDDSLERYETDVILGVKPYRPLFRAFCTQDKNESLSKINEFLKSWYKDLAAAPWHDSHLSDDGYFGYWAFEAGAAVYLLGIEDDSSLYEYLYYPKDLVKFAKEFVPETNDISVSKQEHLRCEAGQICPKTGEWYSPANNMEKRHFNQGEVMPEIKNNPWGLTIWYLIE
ncbi:PoNe immunity protein domain-containing protein [Acinetobacter wuhouensis]|uniref:PoNe immunity protein domain-containing protein n=1 Tax=Acinetobacter wuhouensis TaxID=1879050 RepID=UPI001D0DB3C1|nr:PoNe immunity protein domain-containing protein [Acinetobacter wuhouensis]